MADMPKRQYAVQLVGSDRLVLNKTKEVFRPGKHQILCKVEAVGLCFSDLKLLKQFSSHVRKGQILSGIDPAVLREIPSYVPGEKPTVPGHEVVVRIAEVGPEVTAFKPRERYLVQTDYRWLRTATSNGAFGYNFEGALQEYVLMDLRVITSPDGESMLLAVGDELSASAIALVEPWACVEDAYASKERAGIKAGGQMLVVADTETPNGAIENLVERYGKPGRITWVGTFAAASALGVPVIKAGTITELGDGAYDDVVYLGGDATTVETLFGRLGNGGLLNIVLCGARFGRDVVVPVGRVHYGGIRIVGTVSNDPCESMAIIPEGDEIRHGDRINVIGAGGPMGMMHVIRNICQGVEGVSVYASDVDDNRLKALSRIVEPLARKNGVAYRAYNATKERRDQKFDYAALMAPVPALVVQAVHDAAEGGLINIFAGIPATVTGAIDLDAYISNRLYLIGTSGSTLDDMKRMLAKTESGRLDTNVSVAAISGMAGATEGIRAVENRTVAGKIIVYPACRELGLIRLEELARKMPDVAAYLKDGLWTGDAERVLLEKHGGE
jgi:threonine dehydrogenase-like Zn-dependent dehydrogenase